MGNSYAPMRVRRIAPTYLACHLNSNSAAINIIDKLGPIKGPLFEHPYSYLSAYFHVVAWSLARHWVQFLKVMVFGFEIYRWEAGNVFILLVYSWYLGCC